MQQSRTHLAIARTILANHRTLLAYVRTALVQLIAALTFLKLFDFEAKSLVALLFLVGALLTL